MRKLWIVTSVIFMSLAANAPADAGYWWASASCAGYRDMCMSLKNVDPKRCEAAYRLAMASGDEYQGLWANHWTCSKK